MQTEEASELLYVPGQQGVHVSVDEEVAFEKNPGGHGLPVISPSVKLNVPGGLGRAEPRPDVGHI